MSIDTHETTISSTAPALRREIARVASAAPGSNTADLIRPRLVQALASRFDIRVVKVVGHAGFGKTTALVHAVEQNTFEPQGVDAWISLLQGDAVDEVIERTITALGGDPNQRAEVTTDDVIERVWAMAPKEVCLIFDDVHLVDDSGVQAVLETLLDRLPSNGHMVFASRTQIPFTSAKLNAAGQVLTIGQEQLSFTDDEIAKLTKQNELESTNSDVERWPAQLALASRGGVTEQVRYLSEEILAAMPEARIDMLATLALLGICDQQLLRSLPLEGVLSLEEAVDDLPLVQRYESGVVRLHDLWSQALADRLSSEKAREILTAAAKEFFERGDFTTSLALSAKADDDPGVRLAGLQQASRPVLGQQREELARCCALLAERELPVLRQTFEALELWGRKGMLAAWSAFEQALSLARTHQDLELESIIVHRLEQSSVDEQYRSRPLIAESVDRLRSSESDRARLAVLHFDISHAISQGATVEAKELIGRLPAVVGPVASHYSSMFLADLGCPEEVGGTPDEQVAEGTEIFWALASWLRGDVSPEDALEIAKPLLEGLPQGAAITRQSTFGILTIIADTAGETKRSNEFLAATEANTPLDLGSKVAAFSRVARASNALAGGDEDAAGEHLRDALTISTIADWLYRCYLPFLPGLFVLCPEVRDRLRSFSFGPSLSTAISYGEALVEVRETQKSGAVTRIDWSNTNLLRVHVSPPHLVELVVAGSLEKIDEARRLLGDIPNTAELLVRVADRYKGPIRKEAKRLLQDFPPRPSEILRLDLLGEVKLTRGAEPVLDPDWRRSRVQELLAWLVLHGGGSRERIGDTLWPDLDSDAAQNNLRVHLSYLNRILEPDRPKGVPPWFIRSDGDRITLTNEGVVTDVAELNEAYQKAVDAERAGSPQVALQSYGVIIDLWNGDLLSSLGDPMWALFDRLELQSAASTACIRTGELNLAKGEPEAAVDAARKALRIDPLSQRAGRLFVKSLRGTGDASGSRRAAREFVDLLIEHGEPVEPETQRLLDS